MNLQHLLFSNNTSVTRGAIENPSRIIYRGGEEGGGWGWHFPADSIHFKRVSSDSLTVWTDGPRRYLSIYRYFPLD